MLKLPVVSQEISYFLALNPKSDLINLYLLVAWILRYFDTFFQDLHMLGDSYLGTSSKSLCLGSLSFAVMQDYFGY